MKWWWYMHAMECYIAVRNVAVVQFAATWMELEDAMLKEVSQKYEYRMIPFICDI